MPVYRATIFATLYGQQIRNVIQFFREGGTQAEMNDLAIAIQNKYLSAAKFASNTSLGYYNVHVEVPSQPGWTPIEHPVSINGNLADTGTVVLPVSAVIWIKTNDHTRKGTGRIYIAGVGANGVSGGFWNASSMAVLQDMCNTFLHDFGGTPVGSGFTIGVAPRTNPDGNFKEVVQIIPRNYPGMQVRRNFKRGS